jgi:hypothetical protein
MYQIEDAKPDPWTSDQQIAELLGVISRQGESINRLGNVIAEYRAISEKYRGMATGLSTALERARRIAALLEDECARCWGPVHAKNVEEARDGA